MTAVVLLSSGVTLPEILRNVTCTVHSVLWIKYLVLFYVDPLKLQMINIVWIKKEPINLSCY